MNLKAALSGTTVLGASLPFAHLLGLAPRAAAAAADDNGGGDRREERDRREGESDAEYDERMRTLDEEEARRAEEEREDEPNADAEDGDPEDKEDEDEDGDDEPTKKAKRRARSAFARGVRAARLAENARCRAIFAAPHAGVRPDVAASLAFETRLAAKEAVAVLNATASGRARGSSLRDAMGHAPTPRISSGGPERSANSHAATAAAIVAAGKRRRGEG